jgi:hypothetical protein
LGIRSFWLIDPAVKTGKRIRRLGTGSNLGEAIE